MCSLISLWIFTLLQNFITLYYLVFELRNLKEMKKKKNKILSHSPIHLDYDARHHAHPYIPSTTVLSDT